jgi:hypothetical protein
MIAEPYQCCQECGRELENTTMYRRHASCAECGGTSTL